MNFVVSVTVIYTQLKCGYRFHNVHFREFLNKTIIVRPKTLLFHESCCLADTLCKSH